MLDRLGLRTIVSLIPEAPTTDLRQFCAAEGITQHVFQAAQFTDAVTLSAGVVARVLEVRTMRYLLRADSVRLTIALACMPATH